MGVFLCNGGNISASRCFTASKRKQKFVKFN